MRNKSVIIEAKDIGLAIELIELGARLVLRKLLILYISFFFFTPIWSQKRPDEKLITYTAVNKPLNIVLKDLAANSNVSLIYSESRIPAAKQISISAKNEKLGDVLNVILDDFKMSYHIVGNQLLLVKISNEDVSGKIRIYGYIRISSLVNIS